MYDIQCYDIYIYTHVYTFFAYFFTTCKHVPFRLGKESLLLTEHLTDGYFTSCLFSPDASMMVTASREPNWEEAQNDGGQGIEGRMDKSMGKIDGKSWYHGKNMGKS